MLAAGGLKKKVVHPTGIGMARVGRRDKECGHASHGPAVLAGAVVGFGGTGRPCDRPQSLQFAQHDRVGQAVGDGGERPAVVWGKQTLAAARGAGDGSVDVGETMILARVVHEAVEAAVAAAVIGAAAIPTRAHQVFMVIAVRSDAGAAGGTIKRGDVGLGHGGIAQHVGGVVPAVRERRLLHERQDG